VAFAGGDPKNPMLDVTATHHSRYGDVDVKIGGSLSAMDLHFSSVEYPDETDIVSILVLGSPLSELSSAQAQSNSTLLSLASAAVMGQIGLGGVVEIETTTAGTAVSVGHAIGNRLFVVLSRQTPVNPGENLIQATVEVNLGKEWTMEFTTGDQGASATDLYRTWRF